MKPTLIAAFISLALGAIIGLLLFLSGDTTGGAFISGVGVGIILFVMIGLPLTPMGKKLHE